MGWVGCGWVGWGGGTVAVLIEEGEAVSALLELVVGSVAHRSG